MKDNTWQEIDPLNVPEGAWEFKKRDGVLTGRLIAPDSEPVLSSIDGDGIPYVSQEGVTAADVTPITAWKAPKALKVPSGNVCLIRGVSLQVFLAQGVIPNSLLPLLMPSETQEGAKKAQKTLDQMGGNPQMLREYTALSDAVCVQVLANPPVHPIPACKACHKPVEHPNHPISSSDLDDEGKHAYEGGTRDDELLYVDEVDLMDKAFIFRRVVMGRMEDAEKFREQQATGVAPMATGPGVANKAKPAPRTRRR